MRNFSLLALLAGCNEAAIGTPACHVRLTDPALAVDLPEGKTCEVDARGGRFSFHVLMDVGSGELAIDDDDGISVITYDRADGTRCGDGWRGVLDVRTQEATAWDVTLNFDCTAFPFHFAGKIYGP